MSDHEVYIDDIVCHDIGEYRELWSILFSNNDIFHRKRMNAHAVVKNNMDPLYGEKKAEFSYFYASAGTVRKRLEIQGYGALKCQSIWEADHRDFVERMEAMDWPPDSQDYQDEVLAIQNHDYDSWKIEYASAVKSRLNDRSFRMRHFTNFEYIDPLAKLALQIDILRPKAVWMDVSDLYSDGEFDPSVTVEENLSALDLENPEDVGPIGKILILTEGKTDSKFLSEALRSLYPEFCEVYEFVDFEGFRIEGGASPLARMIKSFAGVKQQIRILAIFDNDAAGHEALKSLERVRFPTNIRLMALPDISFCKHYPTIGPEGLRRMDVNGAACSIELFLGREALSHTDGSLCPVRWSQWNSRVERYQGEIERKDAIGNRFLEILEGNDSPVRLRKRLPEMNILLERIFSQFSS